MPIRKRTIGVSFPFRDSNEGDFLLLTKTSAEEIKSNLIHLLMTTKGERYFLPRFGTNMRQYIFEQQTDELDEAIRSEINNAVEEFMPNIKIKRINIKHYGDETYLTENLKYRIVLNIDYNIISGNYDYTDNVTINY